MEGGHTGSVGVLLDFMHSVDNRVGIPNKGVVDECVTILGHVLPFLHLVMLFNASFTIVGHAKLSTPPPPAWRHSGRAPKGWNSLKAISWL